MLDAIRPKQETEQLKIVETVESENTENKEAETDED